MTHKVFIGYDSRWPLAYAVAAHSILRTCHSSVEITPLLLPHLQALGYYTRPTTIHKNQMRDEISEAPMATEFAISRFLIPMLMGFKGWALFCDNDFLFRADIAEIFSHADGSKAIMCVHHDYAPPETVKMDGQAQSQYSRKNWSSLMLINCSHHANRFLTLDNVNTLPGRDLHRFCWLKDNEIGELPPTWNWLEGHSPISIEPKAIHFTRGTPDMEGMQDIRYAAHWRDSANELPTTKAI